MNSCGTIIELSRITWRQSLKSRGTMATCNDSAPGLSSQSGFSAKRMAAHSLLVSNCGFSTNLTHCLPSAPIFFWASKRTSFNCCSGTSKVNKSFSTSSIVSPELGINSLSVTPSLNWTSRSVKIFLALFSSDSPSKFESLNFDILGAKAAVKLSRPISTSSDNSAHMNAMSLYLGWAWRNWRKLAIKLSGVLISTLCSSGPLNLKPVVCNPGN
mmetsp:Transcript_17400/g.50153  ORF Transcript_17400/g.50153 Transcript_17400/m.50153 type:complete len:214 (+) Transcript_17400:1058-1699(+)